jgi:hypothetical protein
MSHNRISGVIIDIYDFEPRTVSTNRYVEDINLKVLIQDFTDIVQGGAGRIPKSISSPTSHERIVFYVPTAQLMICIGGIDFLDRPGLSVSGSDSVTDVNIL